VSAGIGDYGSLEATAVVNFPLGDNWATRFSAGMVENDGYNEDGTDSTDDMAFRAQIYGDISDSIDVRLSVDYSTTDGTGNAPTFLGNYGFPLGGPTDNPNNVTGYNFNPAPTGVSVAHSGPLTSASAAYYASLDTTPAFTSPAPQYVPFVNNSYFGVMAELNFDLGFGELVVIPAYREAELDVVFNNPGFQAAFNQDKQDQFSLEARLSTTTGPVDWIFGAYYFDETVDGLASFNQQSIQATQTLNASKSEAKALFADATFNVSDQFRIVAGLRLTDDKKTFDGVSNTFLDLCIRDVEAFPGGPLIPNCAGAPVIPAGATVADTLAQIDPADLPAGPPGIGTGPVPYGQVPLFPGAPPFVTANLLFINPTVVNQELNTDEPTYRLALEYDVTADSLLYVSYETGYRSGGFSLATGREEYLPEFLDAFTIGSKNRFMDDRLQLNAELFFWEYTDQQASHFGVDSNGNNAFFTENIGSSTINGLEIDVQFAATDSTILRGNVQFLDNEIDEYSYVQLTPDEAVRPVSGCVTTQLEIVPMGATWDVNCAGQQGANAPDLSVNLGLDQYFQFAGLDSHLGLDARYKDERWVGFDFVPPQRAESVTTYDATFEFGSSEGTWSVLTYVRNLTDEDVKSIAQVFGQMSNLASTVYMPPRTYGVRFTYTF
jgi:iron complex outermembrane receptor protein